MMNEKEVKDLLDSMLKKYGVYVVPYARYSVIDDGKRLHVSYAWETDSHFVGLYYSIICEGDELTYHANVSVLSEDHLSVSHPVDVAQFIDKDGNYISKEVM